MLVVVVVVGAVTVEVVEVVRVAVERTDHFLSCAVVASPLQYIGN